MNNAGVGVLHNDDVYVCVLKKNYLLLLTFFHYWSWNSIAASDLS